MQPTVTGAAMVSTLLTLAITLAIGAPSMGQAPADPPAFDWPKYQTLRFEEDYSGLAALDAVPARDMFDDLKDIPLNEAGTLRLTVGGQARWRVEGFSNFAFGAPAADDDGFYFMQRYMLWGDLHVGENVRVFIEGRSAMTEDRDLVGGRRTLDQDTLDVLNAFAEARWDLDGATSLTLRGGRQELLFGAQRLISPLNWSNTRRTFDGVTARLEHDDWTIDGFWTQPVRIDKYEFNDWYRDAQDFWGVYATMPGAFDSMAAEAYVLGRHIDAGNVDRYTIGGRLHGPIGDARFDLEGGYQFGDAGANDIQAFFIASEISRSFADRDWSPWIAVGFDYASGDSNPTDGDSETFDQLFPLGHAYLGYIDIIGRQNIIAARISGKVQPTERLWLRGDVHAFWRAEEADALYNAGGGVVTAGGAGTDQFTGIELDLTAGYAISHHWKAAIGYCHFFVGDFAAGPGDDIDFWFTQLQFTF